MEGHIDVRKVMDGGGLRRYHGVWHDGSLCLRHLPPAVGRVWPVVVLVGSGESVIGRILISIDSLVGISIDGRRDGGIEGLHVHLGLLQMRRR